VTRAACADVRLPLQAVPCLLPRSSSESRGGNSWGPPGIADTGYTVPIDDKLRWSIKSIIAGRSYIASVVPANWHREPGVPVHPPFPRGAAPASAHPAVHCCVGHSARELPSMRCSGRACPVPATCVAGVDLLLDLFRVFLAQLPCAAKTVPGQRRHTRLSTSQCVASQPCPSLVKHANQGRRT
jgi:hypothetical protein